MSDKQYGGYDKHPDMDRMCDVHDMHKRTVLGGRGELCPACAYLEIEGLKEKLDGERDEWFDELKEMYTEFEQDSTQEEKLAYRRAVRDMNSIINEETQ